MANYDFWALGESQVTVSDGEQLDGVTQGDGSHLDGLTITLNSKNFEQIFVSDNGSDIDFDDNDSNQRLDGAQTFDGVSYADNIRIEAEYEFTVRDPNTLIEYRILAVNFNNSSPSYGTIEGLAFVDAIPPTGVALEVIDTTEGPRGGSAVEEGNIVAPPCFTPGTMIQTPDGLCDVADLQVGDMVITADHGAQIVRWIGRVDISAIEMGIKPQFRPILIKRNAFGPGAPARDMHVSPQHRILIIGWYAELLFGEPEVLAAAHHLVNDDTVIRDRSVARVTYIHLQFDHHEVVHSDGVWSESFNPGPISLSTIPKASRDELCQLFPGLVTQTHPALTSARRLLKGHEAKLLAAQA